MMYATGFSMRYQEEGKWRDKEAGSIVGSLYHSECGRKGLNGSYQVLYYMYTFGKRLGSEDRLR